MRIFPVLLVLSACGSSFSSTAGDGGDDAKGLPTLDAGDAGDVLEDLEDLKDAPSDVHEDLEGLEHDASMVTSSDASTCTPIAFPLPAPSTCATSTGSVARGSLWIEGDTGACVADNGEHAAAESACEACAETFTCTCIAPILVGTIYACAVDSAGQPFAKQQ